MSSVSAPYMPQPVFSVEEGAHPSIPRVLISPSRYIQGDGVLDHLGRYLSLIPSKRAAILISEGGRKRDGARLSESLNTARIERVEVIFQGECSYEEIDRAVSVLGLETSPVDCLVTVGGGKCIDAGKSIAYRLGIPVAVCPSIASNDAPCSALSVIYAADGAFKAFEFLPISPALVVVDTRIIANAPVRYLVAGMGDAMATWYEERTCLHSHRGRSVIGARPTLAASALAELCANALFEHGVAAVEAVRNTQVNDALESVVEANTLLSGIGFESGGITVAHSITQGLTMVHAVHRNYLHGEMVAIGLLAQLILERETREAEQIAEFFARVGLPIHLGQIGLSANHGPQLNDVIEAAMTMMLPFVRNEPFDVDARMLLDAVLRAHELGLQVEQSTGDDAYRAIHV
uniref:Glycerol dehydrogenase n=1 Tax=Candidatus Kentrum sp. FM TaxID=2126340 RepID=A0A450WBN6_9GAMM|nr:MAG: glycerol dehydrogenase [Candidatus Kentron sp. FM]VFJ63440.1 MAG: glycerol dehydrogenase [Candidatus Kentron sp. FM]VFK14440.1 MAG: glycerol dehydrogenase [Candidatus Kentron sp. FM]